MLRRLYDEHTLSEPLPCGAIKHVAMLGRDLRRVVLVEDNVQVRMRHAARKRVQACLC